ncbi:MULTISPECIES: phytoene/squalene synthase family protein [unclassified Enterococcus]|uniref:phytoene/squalene synthase family protein n=1 Tax=unclassified Enterococcus TaxID=2608891 RepID=UPI001A9B5136|nr:phytoene/squalene synthase family protein [Enterococcus sp. DIV1271a]MBO1299470.1 phytoene/squalene synthase family protein [Enterococcus sp. DIV1271a]
MTKTNQELFEKHAEDFAYCETVIKKYSKSFYAAFSQLPEKKAKSVYAIYAFCRLADDTVDLAHSEEKLLALKQQLDAFALGEIPDEPIWRALSVVFSVYPMTLAPFYDMIEGQKQDLVFTQPETFADLEDYCYYVAGSVGLMLLPLLSDQAEEIQSPAKLLGEAMQLTNILRDIGEDNQMGRIYLPKEMMRDYGVTEAMLHASKPTKSLIDLWEAVASEAEQKYEASFAMLPLIDPNCRLALTAAAMIYKEQLTVIRENHYLMLDRKNYVSQLRKVQLLRKAKKDVEKRKDDSHQSTL